MKRILSVLLLICLIPFSAFADDDWTAALTNRTGLEITFISVYLPGEEEYSNILTEPLQPEEGIMLGFPATAVNDAAILAIGLDDYPMMKFLINTDAPTAQIILAIDNGVPFIMTDDQASDPFFLVVSDPATGNDEIVIEYPGYEESLSYEYTDEGEEYEQDENYPEEEAPDVTEDEPEEGDWDGNYTYVPTEPQATPVPQYKRVKIHVRNLLNDDITEVYMRPSGKKWRSNMMHEGTYIGVGDKRRLPSTITYHPGTNWDIFIRTQNGGWVSFSNIRLGNMRDPWNLTLTISQKSSTRYHITIK